MFNPFVYATDEKSSADANESDNIENNDKTETDDNYVPPLEEDEIGEQYFLGPDRFGFGGDFRFGITTNLRTAQGDFPMNEARRYFTNRFYGVNQKLTLERNADMLNYPFGGDLGLDWYFLLKKKDPSILNDYAIAAYISMNFETGMTGTVYSSGTNANAYYIRDVFIQIEDLFSDKFKIWMGDRRRAGLSMPLTRFRPSLDDIHLRGMGFDFNFKGGALLALDFGYHLSATMSKPIYSQGEYIGEEFVGYLPLDAVGNPLTSDYYVFLDDTSTQRYRPIITVRARYQQEFNKKMILGAGGAFEFIPASPGGRLRVETGTLYGDISDPSKQVEEDDFPADFGFRGGVDLAFKLKAGSSIRMGLGFGLGISNNIFGPSRDFLLDVMNENEFPALDDKKLIKERSLVFGFGYLGNNVGNGILAAELDARFGAFGGSRSSNSKGVLGSDREGHPTSTLMLAATRYEYFFRSKNKEKPWLNNLFMIGGHFTTEFEILGYERFAQLKEYYENYIDSFYSDAADPTSQFRSEFSSTNPDGRHLLAYTMRLFLFFGLNFDRIKVLDGNRLYLVMGMSVLDETMQVLQDPAHYPRQYDRYYIGLQGHYSF